MVCWHLSLGGLDFCKLSVMGAYLPDSHSPDSGPTARKGAQAALLASLVLQLIGRFLYLLPDALVRKIPPGSLRATAANCRNPTKGLLFMYGYLIHSFIKGG